MNGWAFDWAVIWSVLGAAGTGFLGWWKGRKPAQAKIDAAIAAARAEERASVAQSSVADAEGKLYAHLSARIEVLEKSQANLESRFQYALRHIWALETLMRKAGIEPPPFDPSLPTG